MKKQILIASCVVGFIVLSYALFPLSVFTWIIAMFQILWGVYSIVLFVLLPFQSGLKKKENSKEAKEFILNSIKRYPKEERSAQLKNIRKGVLSNQFLFGFVVNSGLAFWLYSIGYVFAAASILIILLAIFLFIDSTQSIYNNAFRDSNSENQ